MKYDLEYYDHMLKIYSKTAEYICKIRWDFIKKVLDFGTVLDYGCGVGWFRAYRPEGFIVDTYDILPVPQTGILHDRYSIICFWDVLEHLETIPDIINKTSLIALTTPELTDDIDLKSWKHYKPGEHIHYFSFEKLAELFKNLGFKLQEYSYEENCIRQDVVSMILKREE